MKWSLEVCPALTGGAESEKDWHSFLRCLVEFARRADDREDESSNKRNGDKKTTGEVNGRVSWAFENNKQSEQTCS